MNTTTPPDFRVLVLQSGKRVWAYGETALKTAQRELRLLSRSQTNASPDKQQEREQNAQEIAAQLALVETHGVWKGVWMKPPIAAMEAEIYQRCLKPKEDKAKFLVPVSGQSPDVPLVYDATREPSARAEVLITGWEFAQPVSMKGFRSLPISIARAIDDELLSIINPSTADSFLYLSELMEEPEATAEPVPVLGETPEPTAAPPVATTEPEETAQIDAVSEEGTEVALPEEPAPALVAGAW